MRQGVGHQSKRRILADGDCVRRHRHQYPTRCTSCVQMRASKVTSICEDLAQMLRALTTISASIALS